MTKEKQPLRILSGVQPSGKLHLGNYFGAVKQHIALQTEGVCFYFIANYHALTTIQNAQQLRDNSRDVTLDYLALGLDPARAVFFRSGPTARELSGAHVCARARRGVGDRERHPGDLADPGGLRPAQG